MTIFPSRSSTGTLKSTRTSTRFPRTSRSRRVSFSILKSHPERSEAESRDDGFLALLHYSITPTIHSFVLHAPCSIPQHLQQFYTTIAVAPFVVVPTDHFHETIAEGKRKLAVEDAGMRIAHNVLRDQRFIAVFQHAFVALVRSRFFKRGIN